jgi:8-oxoguanine deaminase
VVQDRDTILADSERVITRYHERGEGAMIQIALAPCTAFTATKELMIETAGLAERHDCRLHTHLAETRDETDYCLAHFGYRPVDYLEDVGWLTDRVWLAHGIHFNDDEIARLARHKLAVCHCPTSNMVLASGHCRTRELEAAGVTVGLGVDGSASNDNSNLMESVRHALMINRLTYDAKVSHFDALRWATAGSARCLGRSDIGEIAVGKAADLALYKLDELRFSGAGDPLAALVMCGAYRADRVMIAGHWKVEDCMPVGIDIERLRHDHSAAARCLMPGRAGARPIAPGQNIAAPPLGLRHWPVMKVAPGPARKTAAAAISSGRPMRPSGFSLSSASVSGLVEPPVSIGVSVGPGASVLTRMAGANSRAQARVMESTPPFEAQ